MLKESKMRSYTTSSGCIYIDGVNAVNQTEVAKMIHLERSTISKKIDRYLQLSHKSHESHI